MRLDLAMRLPARLARLPFLQSVLPGASPAPASREMSRWFASLPADKPMVIAESLVQRLGTVLASGQSPVRKFRQIEQLLSHAEPLLKRLETQLDGCRLPLDSASKLAAGSADLLLKSFSEACVQLIGQIEASFLQQRFHPTALPQAVLRTAQLIHRRAAIAQRAHASGSRRRWKLMRKLLDLADRHGFASGSTDAREHDSVERVVVRDCLLALCDPAQLEGSELSRIRFYIERFGHLASLSRKAPDSEDHAPGLFVFSDAERGPTRLRPGQELLDKERLLDCRELLARASQQLAGLRQGLHATKLGLPMMANEASYTFMLARCIEQWSEARSRRVIRQDAQPLAELHAGFDPVRQFLAQAAVSRRLKDKPRSPGQAIGKEWRILDQSRAGFGLREAGAQTHPVGIGELVAMRALDRSSTHVCIVRRARALEASGKELGLERLCGTALPSSVEKTLPDGHRHTVPVLMLPRVQCFDGGPGLLAPPGDVTPGMRVTIEQREGNLHFEVLAVTERLASCELAQLKRV